MDSVWVSLLPYWDALHVGFRERVHDIRDGEQAEVVSVTGCFFDRLSEPLRAKRACLTTLSFVIPIVVLQSMIL
jgi:hypothetical protein